MKSGSEEHAALLKFLESVDAFSNLGESSLSLLKQTSRFVNLSKGEILFFQSDPSDAVYLVHSGSISIVLASSDGREMIINEMHKGELFGELGIITQRSRSTSAVARSDSELLVIPRQIFLKIMDNEPQLARTLLEITANRLRVSGKRESALAFLDAQARLARLLLELEEQEQDKGYVTISQNELAHRTGLIRQTVAKALGKWRRAGWLITGRGRILILDKKALERLESNLLV
ncbi:MAG TPA: Crp/Fnr family transcriptional regulator [Anaerolineales bacterium]|nr:Crp/Fnr family transcriptional regulator [Anaerolineales bacterium]